MQCIIVCTLLLQLENGNIAAGNKTLDKSSLLSLALVFFPGNLYQISYKFPGKPRFIWPSILLMHFIKDHGKFLLLRTVAEKVVDFMTLVITDVIKRCDKNANFTYL